MLHSFPFTYTRLAEYYQDFLKAGYTIITCEDYVNLKATNALPQKTIVNRVDIDDACWKTPYLLDIYKQLNIKASFFVRLHSSQYNPFDFQNYRILKRIVDEGHEMGYHSEVIDQAAIWGEDPADCLIRDVKVLNSMFNVDVKGIASHGGMTGLNNLDFWADKTAKSLGFLYEAYDTEPSFDLFNNSFYLSDSNWTYWKCYNQGKLCDGDNRTPSEHIKDGHSLIYFLIHPDTYYHEHFYEHS